MQFIYTHGGVFPVRRGARDEETFITAETILARGGRDHDVLRGRALAHRQSGRAGQARASGAWRSRRARRSCRSRSTAPRSVRNWKRLQFPKVTIQYGEPIRWEPIENPTREQQQAVADQVLVEIRRLYAGLEEHGRKGILRRVREQRRAEPRAQGRRGRLSAAAVRVASARRPR